MECIITCDQGMHTCKNDEKEDLCIDVAIININ